VWECNLVGDRDVVATLNIYRKYAEKRSRCGVPGVALNAPKPDEGPSGVRGNKGDAMKNTSSYTNLYVS